MLTRSYPAGALSAGGGTTPFHLEPAHLSVVPSGGAADERRHHPGRGDPHDAPPSAARGRPATDCPGSCLPSNVRLGASAHAIARGLRSDVCAAEGGLTRLSVCNPVGNRSPSSLPTSPVPRPSPQGTPAALPYPLLRCLSGTSPRRAARAQPPEPGGRRGSRGGAQGSGGRGPEHAGLEAGRWRMVTRGAMCGLACSPLRGQQKSARGPPRSAGDCPCALSVAASRVRLDQDRLVRVCGAATGQSCIGRMLHRVVSRRQAHFLCLRRYIHQ